MHYYQHSIGDYRRDTMHLSLLEHGVYRQLLDLYYLNECELDANALRLICARSAEEIQAAETILNEFFVKTETGYKHTRCDKEIDKFHNKSLKAKASADARWQGKSDTKTNENANAMRTHSEGNANHKPITNNQLYTPPIGESLLKDFLQVRKAKKAGALTETAFNAIAKEAVKAKMTTEQAIEMCCLRGWVGFNASWATDNKDQPKASSWKDKIEYEH